MIDLKRPIVVDGPCRECGAMPGSPCVSISELDPGKVLRRMHGVRTAWETTAGVYRVRNTVSARAYIGSSKDIAGRVTAHMSQLRLGKHPSVLMQADHDELGAKAFVMELIERCALPDLLDREQEWLTKERPAYNQTFWASMMARQAAIKAVEHKLIAWLI